MRLQIFSPLLYTTALILLEVGHGEAVAINTSIPTGEPSWLGWLGPLSKRKFNGPADNTAEAYAQWMADEAVKTTTYRLPDGNDPRFADLPSYVGSTSDIHVLGDKVLSASIVDLNGCTSVIVASRRGLYISHLFEVPSFKKATREDGSLLIPVTFDQDVKHDLVEGSAEKDPRDGKRFMRGLKEFKRTTLPNMDLSTGDANKPGPSRGSADSKPEHPVVGGADNKPEYPVVGADNKPDQPMGNADKRADRPVDIDQPMGYSDQPGNGDKQVDPDNPSNTDKPKGDGAKSNTAGQSTDDYNSIHTFILTPRKYEQVTAQHKPPTPAKVLSELEYSDKVQWIYEYLEQEFPKNHPKVIWYEKRTTEELDDVNDRSRSAYGKILFQYDPYATQRTSAQRTDSDGKPCIDQYAAWRLYFMENQRPMAMKWVAESDQLTTGQQTTFPRRWLRWLRRRGKKGSACGVHGDVVEQPHWNGP